MEISFQDQEQKLQEACRLADWQWFDQYGDPSHESGFSSYNAATRKHETVRFALRPYELDDLILVARHAGIIGIKLYLQVNTCAIGEEVFGSQDGTLTDAVLDGILHYLRMKEIHRKSEVDES